MEEVTMAVEQPSQLHYLIIAQDALPTVKAVLKVNPAECSSDSRKIHFKKDGQSYILSIPDTLLKAGEIPSGQKVPGKKPLNKLPPIKASLSTPKNDVINQTWFTTRDNKDNLLNKGHTWKQGMWSKEETELLQHNILKYCQLNKISDPAAIIFSSGKEERKEFYRNVAKGLNRPLFSVYRRVLRLYDASNHRGRYSPEDLDKLRQLREIHGKNWQAIGAAMGRSASSIKDRCRLMKENCNQGKWSKDEEQRLASAVYRLAGVRPGQRVTAGLSWAAVARIVGSRAEKQCRAKWLHGLNWREAGGPPWTRTDDVQLVLKLLNHSAQDENDVNWNSLAKELPSARSPQWLRGRWWSIKRNVPNSSHLTFKEICQYLYSHQLPSEAPIKSSSDSNHQHSKRHSDNSFQESILKEKSEQLASISCSTETLGSGHFESSSFIQEISIPEEIMALGAEVIAEDVNQDLIITDAL